VIWIAGQYSLKTFLRNTPNDLLRRYFETLRVGPEMGWQELKDTSIDAIYGVIDEASEVLRAQIGRDFQDIHGMANEGGTKTLIDEGLDRHHRVDLRETFEPMGSHTEKAFWAFLEHPDVFEVAKRFRHADKLGRWRKRKDLPDAEPGIDDETTQVLASAISSYYLDKEGRVRGCHADHYARDNRLYWFVYPEDYAEGRLVYDDKHELRLETQRPAFEIIFVYDTEERSLDINAKGPKRTIEALQGMFCNIVLGVPSYLPDRTDVVYQLDGLLSPTFPFRLEPADGVEEVRVKLLRLELVGAGRPRITLEIDAHSGDDALYQLLNDVIASTEIRRDMIRVTKASLRLKFRPDNGSRAPTLTFDVSHPNSCSLKYEPRHEIAKKLLKRWGIDVSGRTEHGSELPGRTVQRTLRV
jgi:hypothetical protein